MSVYLRARHDLVLEAFTAVHALPRLVRSVTALGAVQLLVELLADDAAARAAGRTPLAWALAACASRRAVGRAGRRRSQHGARVRRLSGRGNSASCPRRDI